MDLYKKGHSMNDRCGCEYGENCTKTTVCTMNSAVEEAEEAGRDALEQATAKITTLEADRKKEWDARTVTENKLNERIEQLEAKLERCIWGGHPQPAQDRHEP